MRALLLLFLLLNAPLVSAQQFLVQEGIVVKDSENQAFGLVKEIVAVLPQKEREIARSVEVHIEYGDFDRGPFTLVDISKGRIVIIPHLFLNVLEQMIEAQLMTLDFVPTDFPEEWLTYWGLRSSNHPVYVGSPPKPPLEYSWLSSSEKAQFVEDYGKSMRVAYSAAIVDIVLHEIGHHVTGALYNPKKVPPSVARAQEAKADAWASLAFSNYTFSTPHAGWVDKTNLFGRYMVLVMIRELEALGKINSISAPRTHPETGARLLNALNGSSCDPTDFLCSLLRDTALRMVAENRSESEYRQKVKNGGVFALFKLALMRGSAGDHQEACDLFDRAAREGADMYSFRYVGDCFNEGLLGKDLSANVRLKLAAKAYCLASNDGWQDAKRALEMIADQHSISHDCY